MVPFPCRFRYMVYLRASLRLLKVHAGGNSFTHDVLYNAEQGANISLG